MRYCPQCGQEVEPRDAYCFECGTALGGGHPNTISRLRTVWISLGLAALGVLESAMLLVMPGQIIQQADSFGFGTGLSESMVLAMGAFGLLISLSVGGLCFYYYSEGYVDRRFFWGILGAGVAGLLLAGGISFLLLIAVGIYGLVVFVRRS